MSGFDDPGVYYSDSFGGGEGVGDEGVVKRSQIKKKFREFLRQFRVGTDRTGFTYKYRYCHIRGFSCVLVVLFSQWRNTFCITSTLKFVCVNLLTIVYDIIISDQDCFSLSCVKFVADSPLTSVRFANALFFWMIRLNRFIACWVVFATRLSHVIAGVHHNPENIKLQELNSASKWEMAVANREIVFESAQSKDLFERTDSLFLKSWFSLT